MRLGEVPSEFLRERDGLLPIYSSNNVDGWELVGIDVDDYAKGDGPPKQGAAELRDLEMRLGELPATALSGARLHTGSCLEVDRQDLVDWLERLGIPPKDRERIFYSTGRCHWTSTAYKARLSAPPWRRLGYPASRPASTAKDGTVLPATKGVRLHDFRHTAAVLWLTNGIHFIQVAKWLGHSSYVLTLTTYADCIPDEEATNPLPEPVAPAAPATNVITLHRAAQSGS